MVNKRGFLKLNNLCMEQKGCSINKKDPKKLYDNKCPTLALQAFFEIESGK